MQNREPYNIRKFLVIYNALQVALSAYIVYWCIQGGWFWKHSFICQPVDYSNSREALAETHVSYVYFLAKFTEFIDTFAFVARKKFNQVSTLHVIHHGIMPLSVWPGLRWTPGGHATFFGLLNSFVHVFMYLYYMFAAMGPQYQKYIWWKRHMTNLQMIQFIGIFVHSIQLLFVPYCGFPIEYGYLIAAHAVVFFVLFSQFYVREYMTRHSKKSIRKGSGQSNGEKDGASNGKAVNGFSQDMAVRDSPSSHSYNTRSKKER